MFFEAVRFILSGVEGVEIAVLWSDTFLNPFSSI